MDAIRLSAKITRERVKNSHHIHPEFATPSELAFWLRQFREMGIAYAADLDRWADYLEDENG